MRSFVKQLFQILFISLRTLPSRRASTIVTLVGFAIVSGVLIGVLALVSGISSLWNASGSNNIALALGRGAFAEVNSQLSADTTKWLVQAPGLDHAVADPISPQVLITTSVARESDKKVVSVLVRGFTHPPLAAIQKFELRSGRMFKPGLDEIVVGEKLKDMIVDATEGKAIVINNRSFRVVGVFSSESALRESEIWGSASSISNSNGSLQRISVAYVRLSSPSEFLHFAAYMENVPEVSVDVVRESDYLERQGALFSKIVLIPGAMVIGLMAFAAILGAANTMQSSILSRLRDLATLRAIGFAASAIALGLTIEAAIIGSLGGGLGALLAGALFRNVSGLTSNGVNAMAFTMVVNSVAVWCTVLFSLVMGVLGGIWPAVSAARCNVVEALRRI